MWKTVVVQTVILYVAIPPKWIEKQIESQDFIQSLSNDINCKLILILNPFIFNSRDIGGGNHW